MVSNDVNQERLYAEPYTIDGAACDETASGRVPAEPLIVGLKVGLRHASCLQHVMSTTTDPMDKHGLTEHHFRSDML
jgi:hypothetical protein